MPEEIACDILPSKFLWTDTRHVCDDGSGSFMPEDISLGDYNYDFTASFELPSRHFIFNGTSTGTTGGDQHDCILFNC